MKYNIYAQNGEWLGTIHASNEVEAVLKFAKEFKSPQAYRAEVRDEPIYRNQDLTKVLEHNRLLVDFHLYTDKSCNEFNKESYNKLLQDIKDALAAYLGKTVLDLAVSFEKS